MACHTHLKQPRRQTFSMSTCNKGTTTVCAQTACQDPNGCPFGYCDPTTSNQRSTAGDAISVTSSVIPVLLLQWFPMAWLHHQSERLFVGWEPEPFGRLLSSGCSPSNYTPNEDTFQLVMFPFNSNGEYKTCDTYSWWTDALHEVANMPQHFEYTFVNSSGSFFLFHIPPPPDYYHFDIDWDSLTIPEEADDNTTVTPRSHR